MPGLFGNTVLTPDVKGLIKANLKRRWEMKIYRAIILVGILTALTLAACSSQSGIEITDPWARPALKDGNGAAYFILENNSGADDVLLSASTDAAAVVELHDVVMIDAEMGDGMENNEMGGNSEMAEEGKAMQMVRQENVPVAAGETVTFKPGSFHVMLIGLTSDLSEGDSIEITLVFAEAGETTITVPVEQR
jgi:copper(I)-binding protein